MNWKSFLESVSSNKYYLPSYEECLELCTEHGDLIFYETKTELEGYPISIFNYRLAQYSHFVKPIPGKPDISAFEMRGLTFVFNKDGSLFRRFLLLDKFFNMNQTPCSTYSIVKDMKIKNVYNKEDGSIASFIILPNGSIYGKSKTSFKSDQAIWIQDVYDKDSTISKTVRFFLEKNINPIFEFVSPQNRIVVPYANTDLILLRLRDNITGEYLDIDEYTEYLNGITVAANLDTNNLDDLVEVVFKMVGKEGVIVQFEDGKMVKLKSPWYVERHRLFTTELNRENTLIGLILNDTIDDVIAQIEEETKKNEINEIIEIVTFKIGKMRNSVNDLLKSYNGDIKEFALAYRKHPMFSIAIGAIRENDPIDIIKKVLKRSTKNLAQARAWLQEARKEYEQEKL